MSQPAKAEEPSMEEILASIRRIIADDDANKKPAEPAPAAAPSPAAAIPARPAPPPRAPVPPPPRPAAPPPPAAGNNQDDIDAMLADLEAPAKAPPPPLRPAAPAAPDVLELTESMAAATPAATFRTIEAQSDVVFADKPPEPPAEPAAPRVAEEPRRAAAPAAAPEAAPVMLDHMLLSNRASAAVDNAFNSLAHTVLSQNARTLDDIVREMLRPMLKTWLDDNLPGMVERIVRAEIERVSRGRP